VTIRKSPIIILALTLLLISSFAFSDSEYFYNDLEDGVEIAGCNGDCYLLPEHIEGKGVIGVSDTAFFSMFIGNGFVLTWNSGYDIPIDNPGSYDNPIDNLDNTYRPYPYDIFDNINRPIPIQEYPIRHEHYTVPSVKIPPGYQYIGANFFRSHSLKNVSLNEGLRTIGMLAFASNDIRDIVIPDTVSEISSGAFFDNPLSHIIFLGNRPNIGDGAFASRHMGRCIYDSRGELIHGSTDCSAVAVRPEILPCVSKAHFTEDMPILAIGLEPQDCEYDAIFFPQEGWGPIYPPGALTYPFLESSLDGLFDDISGDDYDTDSYILAIDELAELARQLPESEISNYLSLEDMHPPKIYYCSGNLGWPGEPINGVTPEERDCDSVVWDIDQNNSVDALTDGLLLMRYAFGLRGDSLTENVISSDSLIDKAAVEENIEQIMYLVDINDDGNFDALTDALILLRYLFDVTGNGLVDEEMLTSNRPSAGSIKAYIESYMIKVLSN
jgi:hypothetical protein